MALILPLVFLLPTKPILLPNATTMDIKHLTSDTLRSLLGITSKKEQLIKAVADIENEIAKALKGAVTAVADTVTPSKPAIRKKRGRKAKITRPAKAKKKARKPAKSKKQKGGITPEGRAKLAANMKARWAARKAGKPASKIGKPAKKALKLPKAAKNPF
ncbi:MAG: hypothetical protein WCH98_05280 [Verrucomicrobiota bacterium]